METIKLGTGQTRLFIQRDRRTGKNINYFYLGSGGPARIEKDDRTWNPLADQISQYGKMTLGEKINFTGQTYLIRIV